MNLKTIIDLVNAHMRDEGGLGFPRLVNTLPKEMNEQRSDIPGIEKEWVWQKMDQFDNYHGEIAFKVDNDLWLIFTFFG